MATLGLGSKSCQCAECGEYFKSVSAFDMHRVFIDPKVQDWELRRCLSADEMLSLGMAVNSGGYWVSRLWREQGLEQRQFLAGATRTDAKRVKPAEKSAAGIVV